MIVQLSLSDEEKGFGPFEAIRFTGTPENYTEVESFVGELSGDRSVIAGATGWLKKTNNENESGYGPIWIHSFSGIEKVESGDWIVKSKGRAKVIFPVNRLVFDALFETNIKP